jgi:uncharacterized protein (DUF2236 family)
MAKVTPLPMETVTATDLEQQLAELRVFAPEEREGVFGPASVIWRIDREAAIFLGAGRALLLQLAHPWVAAAIFEHSRTFTDPTNQHRNRLAKFAPGLRAQKARSLPRMRGKREAFRSP